VLALAAVAALLWWQVGRIAPRENPNLAARRRAAVTAKRKPKPAPPKPVAPPSPPAVVKGVYYTRWSAGIRSRIDYLVDLKKTTEMNAVVIDLKDYSGRVLYRMDVPQAEKYGAEHPTVKDIDTLIGRLHQEGIYVIGRVTVFQDPVLAEAHPELAVKNADGPGLWLDRKGLAWIDPGCKAAWDYNAAIAADARRRGFDELNFDYVRFPSDGHLKNMRFPCTEAKTPKRDVIRKFFGHMRQKLDGTPISVDLFGLATVNEDDLGIGQIIEDGYTDFDAVCPMVYPSHFAKQFLGFENPAEHPYDVVDYSIQKAAARLAKLAPARSKVKLRPWLQDFNLGAKYDAKMVEAEIKAVKDALGDRYAGYLMWSPSNVYTREALK
jgi:hypothetical protein